MLLVALASCGGSDTQARPKSWGPFCKQLRVIKTSSESGSWFTADDPNGSKAWNRYYRHLQLVAPSTEVAGWLKSGEKALRVGPYDAAFRAAIPAAKRLQPVVERECGLTLVDVFKVGGY